MKCIFICGPPASGKLTIAKELVELTGYSLMHNHQTRNIVHEMYPHALEQNYELVHRLRLDIFEYTATHNTDIVFTFVWDNPNDVLFVDRVIELITENGGEVLFVQTTATHQALLDRVANKSREENNKLTDVNKLKQTLSDGVYQPLPYENIFTIDTTTTEARDAAKLIVQHYNL